MQKATVNKELIRRIQDERSDRLKAISRAMSRRIPMRTKNTRRLTSARGNSADSGTELARIHVIGKLVP